MTRLLTFLALFLCWCGPALPGAWLRDQGSGFVSASARFSWPQDIEMRRLAPAPFKPTGRYHSAYLEYGLTDRLTVGLDVGRGASDATKTLAFARIPLRDRDSGARISAALGLGEINGEAVVRPGLSVGLGLEGGWLNADAMTAIRTATREADLKLDLTYGLRFDSGRMLILQLQTGQLYGQTPFVRLQPSVVIPIGAALKVELGGSYGLSGDNSFGALLGAWAEF